MELREYYKQIQRGENIRQNLSGLKTMWKEPRNRPVLRELFERDPQALLEQLGNEDAKVRKNAALILGALGTEGCQEALFDAYQREETLYVRSAYLSALKGCDCSGQVGRLKERRRELLAQERTTETEKHLREELAALNALIGEYEKPGRHRFAGGRKADVILTTHRNYREATDRQITEQEKVPLKAGVKVLGADLLELLSIRTFRELLFCLNVQNLQKETAAEQLAASDLLQILDAFHEGEGPYFFRIECKSRMSLEQRSAFTKKLADRLQMLTGGRLENSTSDYEVELRLIEGRDGGFYPLLKLYTLPDRRFSYRKNSVAASIQPSLAALLMELARPWLLEDARVLDPFCGVGTMLLERNYLVHADTLYGVDYYGPAISAARENAEIAHVPAHYINRNFLDFTHQYRFDEIVTNMPVKSRGLAGHELDFLYGKLFDRAEELLQEGGCMFLYSHDKAFVKKQLREHKSMELLKEWQIHDREGSWFFAIRYRGGGKAE